MIYTSDHACEATREIPSQNSKEFSMANAREQGFVGPDAASTAPQERKIRFLTSPFHRLLHLMVYVHE